MQLGRGVAVKAMAIVSATLALGGCSARGAKTASPTPSLAAARSLAVSSCTAWDGQAAALDAFRGFSARHIANVKRAVFLSKKAQGIDGAVEFRELAGIEEGLAEQLGAGLSAEAKAKAKRTGVTNPQIASLYDDVVTKANPSRRAARPSRTPRIATASPCHRPPSVRFSPP